jgi:hypothetical protein
MSMYGIESRGAVVANVRGGLHRAGWIAPSGLGLFVGAMPPPRALPWATVECPVGAEIRAPTARLTPAQGNDMSNLTATPSLAPTARLTPAQGNALNHLTATPSLAPTARPKPAQGNALGWNARNKPQP